MSQLRQQKMDIRKYIKEHIDKNFDGELPFRIFQKSLDKDEIITDIGNHESKVYFLKEGIVKVEIESADGIKILDFIFENAFFASYTSLLNRKPSDVRIKTSTKCEVEYIEYAALLESYDTSLLANKLGRYETEKLYLRRVLREKQLLTQKAQENYIALLQTNPDIIQQIPVKEIAQFLGITPESLSRIRKRIIS